MVAVRVLRLASPVANHGDDDGDDEQEGGASGRAGDDGNVGRGEGPVFPASLLR